MKSIPTEIGIKAAELITGVANENNIAIALAGPYRLACPVKASDTLA